MASWKKRYARTAHRLGQRAARRMALLSATVPYDEVDDACCRETEVLGMAVTIAAEDLALNCGRTLSRFEAAVGNALNQETDRILSMIAPGSQSRQ